MRPKLKEIFSAFAGALTAALLVAAVFLGIFAAFFALLCLPAWI